MKRLSYYVSAACSIMLAACMSVTMSSCSNEDNPGGGQDTPVAPAAKVIIKEVNTSGGYKTIADDKNYSWCKGMILYNNSDAAITLKNLALGSVPPANAHGVFHSLDDAGNLIYKNAGWMPVWAAIWYIPQITIAPYSDAVIAINGAIDHSQIATGAFDLSDPSYYAMYAPTTSFVNANAYPEPATIPADHIWNAAVFGVGNAWAISVMCPDLLLFQFPEGIDPAAYCADSSNYWYDGQEKQANTCVKIPNSWVIDGVETFRIGYETDSHKRLTSDIDAGYSIYNSNKGYSLYRNVDKAATEAIADNTGKLVYDYDQAVEGTSEPSGIDAAASIKNGAKIIYQDTNNSTVDFHLRAGWSLK